MWLLNDIEYVSYLSHGMLRTCHNLNILLLNLETNNRHICQSHQQITEQAALSGFCVRCIDDDSRWANFLDLLKIVRLLGVYKTEIHALRILKEPTGNTFCKERVIWKNDKSVRYQVKSFKALGKQVNINTRWAWLTTPPGVILNTQENS